MMKLAPEWVRTSDPVIRSQPAMVPREDLMGPDGGVVTVVGQDDRYGVFGDSVPGKPDRCMNIQLRPTELACSLIFKKLYISILQRSVLQMK